MATYLLIIKAYTDSVSKHYIVCGILDFCTRQ